MNREFYLPNKPSDWNPVTNINDPVIRIEDDGRFMALVAPFGVCLNSDAKRCQTAPKSPTNYDFAHNGGFAYIPYDIEHVDRHLNAREARDIYADSACALARVRYYDLDDGIYAFGELSPFLTADQIDWFSQMSLSGDWRKVGDSRRYDLVASQLVPVPGFRREDAFGLQEFDGLAMVASFGDECDCAAPEFSAGFETEVITASFAEIKIEDEEDEEDVEIIQLRKLALLNSPTGDRRIFKTITFSPEVKPISYDHDDGVRTVIGRVEGVFIEGNVLWGTCVFEKEEYVKYLRNGAGLSVELDSAVYEPGALERWVYDGGELVIESARLRGVSVVKISAFEETAGNQAIEASESDRVEKQESSKEIVIKIDKVLEMEL